MIDDVYSEPGSPKSAVEKLPIKIDTVLPKVTFSKSASLY